MFHAARGASFSECEGGDREPVSTLLSRVFSRGSHYAALITLDSAASRILSAVKLK